MKRSGRNRTLHLHLSVIVLLVLLCMDFTPLSAQATYGAGASYGLRKLYSNYGGYCIRIRRSCDNATKDIGFNTCGGLDTTALRAFMLVANPLTSITASSSAAFSLRRLSCSYAGKAVQVRRSSDNATQDIGFTSDGDLDTIALKTFIGSSSAFVTIWYDQSGNGRNASQGTTTKQPRLVNAGVIDRQGLQPSIYFPGMGYGLFTANLNIFGSAASFNGVAKVNANVTYNTIVNTTLSNIPSPLDHYNNQVVVGNGTTYTFFTPSQTFNAAQPLGIWTYDATSGGNANMYLNSTSILSGSVSSFGSGNTPLAIGSRNDGVTGLNGWISEVITFASVPSATDRKFVEWTQSQYYNISGVTLGTLPANAMSAFVTSWYDQTGNSLTLTQSTTANQPRIMSAGVLSSPGGFPGLPLDGSNYYMSQSTLNISNPYTANAVAIRSANGGSGGYQRLLNLSATGDAYGYLGVLGGNYATFTGNGSAWNDIAADITLTAVALNTRYTLSMTVINGASGLTPYINGTALNTKAGTASTATGFIIGAPYNATNTNQLWTGTISECTIYPSALSTTQRRLSEANQAAYYNMPISNNKYTPPSALAYNLFVNGVGRESATDSIAGTRYTTGMGFKVGQTASDFLKDNGDYLTIGQGCIVANGTSTANLPGTVVLRWSNDWYLNKTDVSSNNGTVTVFFDFSDYGVSGLPGAASNYLLMNRATTAANFAIVAGTTVSVSGDRVSFSVDASNLTTAMYYTIGTRNITSSPLPVELIAFDGTACSSSVCLHWETATELNNAYFVVERSADALNFETIGKVNSKAENGSSNQLLNYTFKDNTPLHGLSYYRLNQFDVDGKSKKSHIISVQFDASHNVSFVIYPNPNSGEFSVDFSGLENNHELQVSMLDMQGRPVYRNMIDLQDLGSGTFKIVPDKKLEAGSYLVVFELQGIRYTSKIIVE